ncbi:hypothetical protein BDZ45DRAFT_751324 [Acephala macrosclerotiorum]|nr:hypothetical protein BDZ45DRAFT_751324 [Acephala macrosclerotiorum]
MQAIKQPAYEQIEVEMSLSKDAEDVDPGSVIVVLWNDRSFNVSPGVTDVVEKKNPHALKDLLVIHGKPANCTWPPKSPQEITVSLFHLAYLGMEENSSPDTRKRAKDLAKEIGSYHPDLNINTVYYAVIKLFTTVAVYVLKYKVHGGTPSSNLALQNIQARLRMVLSYLFAQLLYTVRSRNTDNS